MCLNQRIHGSVVIIVIVNPSPPASFKTMPCSPGSQAWHNGGFPDHAYPAHTRDGSFGSCKAQSRRTLYKTYNLSTQFLFRMPSSRSISRPIILMKACLAPASAQNGRSCCTRRAAKFKSINRLRLKNVCESIFTVSLIQIFPTINASMLTVIIADVGNFRISS